MNHYLITAAQKATSQLGGKWHGDYGMAQCPAHSDSKASLSIKAGEKVVLYHCFAGCSQEAVLSEVRRRGIGRVDASLPVHKSTLRAPNPKVDMKRLALDIWDKAKNIKGTPAEKYLERRGIFGNGHVRFDPKSKTREAVDGESKLLTFPALVTPIHDNHGFVAIQRVFLTEDGEKADLESPKKILGTVGAGSIRLGAKPTDRVNLAEGFEDAQSAIQLNGLSHCWAVAGIERYKLVDLPETAKRIAIYSQHDQAAKDAIEGAREHLTQGGRELDIILPPPRVDWNERLMETC